MERAPQQANEGWEKKDLEGAFDLCFLGVVGGVGCDGVSAIS
jgi:hypothetical protein